MQLYSSASALLGPSSRHCTKPSDQGMSATSGQTLWPCCGLPARGLSGSAHSYCFMLLAVIMCQTASYQGKQWFNVVPIKAKVHCRLADKALDILHHLSCRGSVWPEASATAVRELRDRITQRPSRPSGASGEIDMRTNRATDPSTAMPQHYTSSSGLNPQLNEPSIEPNHSSSSTGLPQERAGAYAMQSVAVGSVAPNNSMGQTASANPQAGNVQTFNGTSSVTYQSISTPIFDFGSSEWSDFIQANEGLDSSVPLPQVDGMDPYIGFDIPFWLGQDQYWDMLHDRN